MRDRFVGDVGDFGKYGLLRALCGRDLRLGVVWYYVGDRMTTYLRDPGRFSACDPQLFETLRKVVDNCQRKLSSIKDSGIFPQRTVFFPEPVPTQLEMRQAWGERAAKEMKQCHVVFLDPDNGLRADPPVDGKVSSQYVYHSDDYSDIKPFFRKNRTIVIYHHLARIKKEAVESEVQWRAAEIRKHLGIAGDVWALVWHPYAPRAYFIIPNGREAVLRPRIEAMHNPPWGEHFERIL